MSILFKSEYTGKEVRATREACGLSQQGLAEKLKVSVSTIAKWEAEPNKPIKVKYNEDLKKTLFLTAAGVVGGAVGVAGFLAATTLTKGEAQQDNTHKAEAALGGGLLGAVGALLGVLKIDDAASNLTAEQQALLQKLMEDAVAVVTNKAS